MYPPRVAVVEDQPAFRTNLCALIEGAPRLQLVGCYATGHEAIQHMLTQQPEVALIDLGLPDISGVEIIQHLAAQGSQTECLVLTVYDDDTHLFAALRAGAVGYIVKNDATLEQVVSAIQTLRDGEAPMSTGIARRILQHFRGEWRQPRSPLLRELTARERQVLGALVQGLTTRRVAEALGITYTTVRHHQKIIYQKLQVNSLVEALAVFRGERRT